ncbi:ankyrin repeat domain-containing protein [Myxococcus fulvus]|uniref:ankyrin repeat domain-containing protein n=1 Tax=Myxococcus fulvus TaxID=33 RepID=UPI003B9DACAB
MTKALVLVALCLVTGAAAGLFVLKQRGLLGEGSDPATARPPTVWCEGLPVERCGKYPLDCRAATYCDGVKFCTAAKAQHEPCGAAGEQPQDLLVRPAEATPSVGMVEDPVMDAVLRSDGLRLRELLVPGRIVNLPGRTQATRNLSPLMAAAEKADVALTRLLLSGGADPSLRVPRHAEAWPPHGWTARCFARFQGADEVEQGLVGRSTEAEAHCLMEANLLSAFRSRDSTRAVLLSRQLRGRVQVRVLERAAELSLKHRSPLLMRAAVGAGWVPPKGDEASFESWPAYRALLQRDLQTLEVLVEAGARWPPLAELARLGHADLVRRSLEAGADPNAQLPRLPTPLVAGVQSGSSSVVDVLLEKGADPNLPSRGDVMPLGAAVNRPGSAPADEEIVGLLLEANANPSTAGKVGALLYAATEACRPSMIPLVLRHGALWDKATQGAFLYLSALDARRCPGASKLELLQALLAAGVTLSAEDAERHDAQWREAILHPPFAEVLRQAGLVLAPVPPKPVHEKHLLLFDSPGDRAKDRRGEPRWNNAASSDAP